MIETLYRIPYSKSFLEFRLPPGVQATRILSRKIEPLRNVSHAIQASLSNPVGTSSLVELAKPGNKVCIVFTDSTRASPDHLFVPLMLKELKSAGIRDEDITLLCGTGMHRPSTRAEKIAKLSPEIVDHFRVIDNDPQNPALYVDLRVTQGGIPVQVHRAAVEADLLIATGIVEPHQYAGYSGGCKTLAVGAAGEALIAHTHGPAFIDNPNTRLGKVEGNPFQEAVREAARRAGLRFIVNAVLDDEQRILRVRAGDPILAHEDLAAFARSVFEVSIPHQYDIVIGGVGYPKDTNLYQASRAASYLFFAPIPVVRPGGFLIIPARCEEGVGIGVGEQRFLSAMRDAPDIQYIVNQARHSGYTPGQQRAFVMAKGLEQAHVIIVGSECPNLVAECKMIPTATMEEAIDHAVKATGEHSQVLIVPHALLTLPIIGKAD